MAVIMLVAGCVLLAKPADHHGLFVRLLRRRGGKPAARRAESRRSGRRGRRHGLSVPADGRPLPPDMDRSRRQRPVRYHV